MNNNASISDAKALAVETLHREGCSCVIAKDGAIKQYHNRGVKDLLYLLKNEPEALDGAFVADKVVGKGAAALMALGCVDSVYADVISSPALEMLGKAKVVVEYGECVPNIINRAGDGICPVENLCKDCIMPEECLPLIEQFVNEMSKK
ncbi:MAG: DUF1893 domain-containing protein [Muribaculaceae bacterium]|nr:DUF1893 domain-containing protein [Muribaculaceae bacterium]